MSDYYTVEDLKDRGWTETTIRDHLGKPDKEHPNKQSSLRKPIGFYAKERVLEAEKSRAKRDLAQNQGRAGSREAGVET